MILVFHLERSFMNYEAFDSYDSKDNIIFMFPNKDIEFELIKMLKWS